MAHKNFTNADRLIFWSFGSLPLYNPQYFMDPVHSRYSYWPWLGHKLYWLWVSMFIPYGIYSLLFELGRSRVYVPWTVFSFHKMHFKLSYAKILILFTPEPSQSLAEAVYVVYIYILIARLIGPTWGPPGADRTQVGPMLAQWTLLSG